jgi:assimilatory nitrate reductase catalytic subunit
MYHTTETARMADLVLPAAGWGEKDGTFINSERRIGTIKKVRRAPGQALADFSIFRLLAERWGCGEMFSRWKTPEAVFQILKELSAEQPCDFTGIEDYRMLDAQGGVQWPHAAGDDPPARQRRLFESGRYFQADGKARFYFEPSRPLPEAPQAKFPFLLVTGRGSAAQWHTQTRTAKSHVLRKLSPMVPYAEINPTDARTLGIRAEDQVAIVSQRGRMQVKVVVTPAVQPGQVFIPMHYEATNRLTFAAFDPYSHQPGFNTCAIRIEKSRD